MVSRIIFEAEHEADYEAGHDISKRIREEIEGELMQEIRRVTVVETRYHIFKNLVDVVWPRVRDTIKDPVLEDVHFCLSDVE